MRSSDDPNSLLNLLLLIVPIGAIAVWMWGWKGTLFIIAVPLLMLFLLGQVEEGRGILAKVAAVLLVVGAIAIPSQHCWGFEQI